MAKIVEMCKGSMRMADRLYRYVHESHTEKAVGSVGGGLRKEVWEYAYSFPVAFTKYQMGGRVAYREEESQKGVRELREREKWSSKAGDADDTEFLVGELENEAEGVTGVGRVALAAIDEANTGDQRVQAEAVLDDAGLQIAQLLDEMTGSFGLAELAFRETRAWALRPVFRYRVEFVGRNGGKEVRPPGRAVGCPLAWIEGGAVSEATELVAVLCAWLRNSTVPVLRGASLSLLAWEMGVSRGTVEKQLEYMQKKGFLKVVWERAESSMTLVCGTNREATEEIELLLSEFKLEFWAPLTFNELKWKRELRAGVDQLELESLKEEDALRGSGVDVGTGRTMGMGVAVKECAERVGRLRAILERVERTRRGVGSGIPLDAPERVRWFMALPMADEDQAREERGLKAEVAAPVENSEAARDTWLKHEDIRRRRLAAVVRLEERILRGVNPPASYVFVPMLYVWLSLAKAPVGAKGARVAGGGYLTKLGKALLWVLSGRADIWKGRVSRLSQGRMAELLRVSRGSVGRVREELYKLEWAGLVKIVDPQELKGPCSYVLYGSNPSLWKCLGKWFEKMEEFEKERRSSMGVVDSITGAVAKVSAVMEREVGDMLDGLGDVLEKGRRGVEGGVAAVVQGMLGVVRSGGGMVWRSQTGAFCGAKGASKVKSVKGWNFSVDAEVVEGVAEAEKGEVAEAEKGEVAEAIERTQVGIQGENPLGEPVDQVGVDSEPEAVSMMVEVIGVARDTGVMQEGVEQGGGPVVEVGSAGASALNGSRAVSGVVVAGAQKEPRRISGSAVAGDRGLEQKRCDVRAPVVGVGVLGLGVHEEALRGKQEYATESFEREEWFGLGLGGWEPGSLEFPLDSVEESVVDLAEQSTAKVQAEDVRVLRALWGRVAMANGDSEKDAKNNIKAERSLKGCDVEEGRWGGAEVLMPVWVAESQLEPLDVDIGVDWLSPVEETEQVAQSRCGFAGRGQDEHAGGSGALRRSYVRLTKRVGQVVGIGKRDAGGMGVDMWDRVHGETKLS